MVALVRMGYVTPQASKGLSTGRRATGVLGTCYFSIVAQSRRTYGKESVFQFLREFTRVNILREILSGQEIIALDESER